MPGPITSVLESIDRRLQASNDTLNDIWQLQTIQLNVLSQIGPGGGGGGAFQPGFRLPTTQHLPTQLQSYAGSMVGSLMGSMSAFTAAGNVVETFGTQISRLPIPVIAQVAGGLISFAGSLLRSVDTIQNWSRNLAKADMEFAKVSPAMALVEARQELRDVSYGIRMGGRLAPSTEKLNQEFSAFREERMGLDVAFKSSLNQAATGILMEMRGILHYLKSGELVVDVGDLDTSEEMQHVFSDASNQFWHAEDYGKDDRFKGGKSDVRLVPAATLANIGTKLFGG